MPRLQLEVPAIFETFRDDPIVHRFARVSEGRSATPRRRWQQPFHAAIILFLAMLAGMRTSLTVSRIRGVTPSHRFVTLRTIDCDRKI